MTKLVILLLDDPYNRRHIGDLQQIGICRDGATTNSPRQSSKIRELAEAVKSAGFLTLDEQAKALGLSRSTAWTIRKASHKASGLSASIINRMLAAPELPSHARTKILEYVEEKAAGLYGGSRSQRRKFAARLSIEKLPVVHSLIGTASRSEKDQRAAGTQPLKIHACELKQGAEVQP